MMAIDGFEWDAPDTPANAEAFGYAGSGDKRSAFPKVRVVTVSECASHAMVDAAVGGQADGEQTLARRLYGRLDSDWLLIADRNFYSWTGWAAASASGAELLWRVKSDLSLPVIATLPDGSYTALLVNPAIKGKTRARRVEAAHGGEPIEEDQARVVRVIECQVPDRDGDGELICLITTITEHAAAPAMALAGAYHQRWGAT